MGDLALKLLMGTLVIVSSVFSFYVGYWKGFSDNIYINSPGDAYERLRAIKFMKSGATNELIDAYEMRAKIDLANWRIFKTEKIEFISKLFFPEIFENQQSYLDKIKKMEQEEM